MKTSVSIEQRSELNPLSPVTSSHESVQVNVSSGIDQSSSSQSSSAVVNFVGGKATAGKFPVSHPPPSYNFTKTPTQKHYTNCIKHFRIDFFFKDLEKTQWLIGMEKRMKIQKKEKKKQHGKNPLVSLQN